MYSLVKHIYIYICLIERILCICIYTHTTHTHTHTFANDPTSPLNVAFWGRNMYVVYHSDIYGYMSV